MKKGFVRTTVIYISLVSLIPMLFGSEKGSGLNTTIKAFVLLLFIYSAFKYSKYQIRTYGTKLLVVFLYSLSQMLCLIFGGGINYLASIVQIGVLFVLMIPVSGIIEDDITICNGIKLYLFFVVFAILYNIVTNFSDFSSMRFIYNIDYTLYSFFDNKNTYGMILFVGLVLTYCLKALNCNYKKGFLNALTVIQILAIIFSLCRTALLCTGIFMICYYMSNGSVKHIRTVLAGIILIIVCFSIPTLREFLLYHIIRIDVGTYRENIHEGALTLIKQSPLFGYGEDNFVSRLAYLTGNMYAHNGFYTVLLDGGIIYLCAYVSAYFLFFKQAIFIRLSNKQLGNLIVIFLICTIVYSLFEGIIIFGSSASNMAFCLVAYVLPSVYRNKLLYSSVEDRR